MKIKKKMPEVEGKQLFFPAWILKENIKKIVKKKKKKKKIYIWIREILLLIPGWSTLIPPAAERTARDQFGSGCENMTLTTLIFQEFTTVKVMLRQKRCISKVLKYLLIICCGHEEFYSHTLSNITGLVIMKWVSSLSMLSLTFNEIGLQKTR